MSSLSTIVGQRYAFAHGRLGVLRQSLLGRSDMDRLLGARSVAEAEQILTEMKLTNGIDQSLRDADSILAALGAWVRREADGMVDVSLRDAFRILWIEDDLPLLSYLLKRRAGLTSAISAEPTSSASAYGVDELRAAVEGTAAEVPAELADLLAEAAANPEPSPEWIDTLVARFGAAMRVRWAKASGSDQIRRFVRHAIDIQNVRTALRLRDEAVDRTKTFLLDGGTIPSASLAGSLQDLRIAVAGSDLQVFLQSALADLDDPTALERGFADLVASDIDPMWDRTLGVEPPFAFAATVLSHLRFVRATMLGKRSGLSPQDVKKILPPFLNAFPYAS